MNRTKLLWLILLSVAVFPFAKLGAQDDMDFRARLFTINSNDGLSQGFVPSIVQDHRGFIWFATKDGLNRYDGYSFSVYRHDPEDSNSVSDNFILDIFEDSRGYLWVSTPAALQVFDVVTDKFYTVFTGTKEHGTPAIMYEDADGNIWSRGGGGMLKLSVAKTDHPKGISFADLYSVKAGEAFSTNVIGGLEKNNDAQFSFDADRSLWVYKGDSIYYLTSGDLRNGKLTAFYHQSEFCNLPDGKIRFIYPDAADNEVVFICSTGIAIYDVKQKKLVDSFDATISSLTAWNTVINDESGNIWFSTDENVQFYDRRTRTLHNFLPSNIDATLWHSYSVKAILSDRSGIMWMGTNGFGAFKYNPRVSCFNTAAITGVSFINGTNDGKIFLGQHEDIYNFDQQKGVLGDIAFRDPMYKEHLNNEDRYPHDFVQDDQDVMWLDYGAGVLGKCEPGSKQVKLFRLLIPPDNLTFKSYIWLDKKQDPWITFERNDSIYISHFNKGAENFDAPVAFPAVSVSGMYRFISGITLSGDGEFWFATTKGLFGYDAVMKHWTKYINIPGDKTSLSNDIVFSVCADPAQPEHYLWVGTNSGGLNCLDISSGKFMRFTEKDGLPNNVIYGLLPDAGGNLWVSTNRGISRFNVQTHGCKNYFASDGLQGNEFNRYVFFKSHNGTLYFGGVNGVSFFDPSKLLGNEHAPTIAFTGFRLFNKDVIPGDSTGLLLKPIDLLDSITLTYEQNVITIGFVAMDFASPDRNEFKYKLDGFDKEWILSGTRHEAIYTGLEPGEYDLLVMAANSEGTWSKDARKIHLIILPPWWQTWWARIIFICLAVLALGAVIYARTYSLRRNQAVLEKKVKERTKELDESIKDLQNMQTQVIKNEKLASFGQLTAGIAHEIKNPLNFINNFSVLSNELIEELKIAKSQEEKEEILNSLQNNLEKINFHGHRVDSIIKSMLNHSRISGARRQLTDVNELCKEFSNLAYHSMRANVQDFSCNLKMEFAKDLPQVNVVPQDMSRVILNLLNNAFYAVNEKRKNSAVEYRPEVMITTKAEGTGVKIVIRDNGSGMPPDVLDKLFDPFFTTKPAGEGTGLGMSITYDIIHSHGGTIAVDSKAGEFTEFVITIPLSGTANENSTKK